jgi:hypothetical protein
VQPIRTASEVELEFVVLVFPRRKPGDSLQGEPRATNPVICTRIQPDFSHLGHLGASKYDRRLRGST